MTDIESAQWFPDGQTYAELAEESAALRRICANTLRRAGCPEDILAEEVERAIADEIRDNRMLTQEGA
jgi:hypothetical protein